MSQIYELKLYNEVLLTFALEKRGLEGLTAQIVSIADKRKCLLPPDMKLADAGMVFLSRRSASRLWGNIGETAEETYRFPIPPSPISKPYQMAP